MLNLGDRGSGGRGGRRRGERRGAPGLGKRTWKGSGDEVPGSINVQKAPPQRPVSRILSAFVAPALRPCDGVTTIPLDPALLTGSSSLPGDVGRAVLFGVTARVPRQPPSAPYLALLRAGFCLPSALQQTRCALTAPFHHAGLLARGPRTAQLCVFCATVLRVTPTGRYPAHCPAEFGLSSPPSPAFALTRAWTRLAARRSSGSLRRNTQSSTCNSEL